MQTLTAEAWPGAQRRSEDALDRSPYRCESSVAGTVVEEFQFSGRYAVDLDLLSKFLQCTYSSQQFGDNEDWLNFFTRSLAFASTTKFVFSHFFSKINTKVGAGITRHSRDWVSKPFIENDLSELLTGCLSRRVRCCCCVSGGAETWCCKWAHACCFETGTQRHRLVFCCSFYCCKWA